MLGLGAPGHQRGAEVSGDGHDDPFLGERVVVSQGRAADLLSLIP
jgi:hypothetical protein